MWLLSGYNHVVSGWCFLSGFSEKVGQFFWDECGYKPLVSGWCWNKSEGLVDFNHSLPQYVGLLWAICIRVDSEGKNGQFSVTRLDVGF